MTHVIKKQRLQLTFPKEQDSWDLQNSFKQVFYDQVVRKLECICDEMNVDLSIDHLEIDTGSIKEKDVEGKWADLIEESFREQIKKLAETEKTDLDERLRNDQKKPPSSKLELIAYFLKMGLLPWWSNKFQPISVNLILSQLIKDQQTGGHRLPRTRRAIEQTAVARPKLLL